MAWKTLTDDELKNIPFDYDVSLIDEGLEKLKEKLITDGFLQPQQSSKVAASLSPQSLNSNKQERKEESRYIISEEGNLMLQRVFDEAFSDLAERIKARDNISSSNNLSDSLKKDDKKDPQ